MLTRKLLVYHIVKRIFMPLIDKKIDMLAEQEAKSDKERKEPRKPQLQVCDSEY